MFEMHLLREIEDFVKTDHCNFGDHASRPKERQARSNRVKRQEERAAVHAPLCCELVVWYSLSHRSSDTHLAAAAQAVSCGRCCVCLSALKDRSWKNDLIISVVCVTDKWIPWDARGKNCRQLVSITASVFRSSPPGLQVVGGGLCELQHYVRGMTIPVMVYAVREQLGRLRFPSSVLGWKSYNIIVLALKPANLVL